jgi:N-acetylglucosaminyldiphosphoundecaprenol N-acetyl-beta-D-mannosaminyltransferase
MPKTDVLGIKYDNVNFSQALEEIYSLANGRNSNIVVTPNAEIAERCFSDKALCRAVLSADYVIPDGFGVVLASKICSDPLKERVCGYDIARELLPLIARDGKKLYILGAKPGIAERAAEVMRADNPGLDICGIHDGYFKDDGEIVSEINSLSPDFLYVALGFPRQEIWMTNNREKLNVGVMLGIGGSIDVFAGEVKRAPDFYIKHHLEWLYRLMKQPSRIGRMMKLPKYVLRAVFSRIFTKLGRLDNES